MWRGAWVLLLLLPVIAHAAIAGAHPGHGPAIVQLLDFPDNRFEPRAVTVGEGDNVIWEFNGNVRNHTVTADDGSFDSDPDGSPNHPPNDRFTHRFERTGTFAYHCKVHPNMVGQVTVVTVGGSDTTPPRISGARVSRRGARYRLRFSLSEPGNLLGRIRRANRTLRAFDVSARQGRNRRRIPTAGLESGRYSILLIAFDRAGNRSGTVRARFRLRRR